MMRLMDEKKNETTLHIVYASDDKFAEIMGVSIISLFENNKEFNDIKLYIFDGGISNENKRKVESVCKKYNRCLPTWLIAKDISKELRIDVAVDRGSLSQYARLFVSSVLPNNIEKVLYLDCDIIINKSIKELWNLDMKGKTIAALMDAFSRHYRDNIGLQPNEIMFNSGVMLIDLVRWKEERIEDKLMKFILYKGGRVQQGDQGALNAILAKDVVCFEPRFNSITVFYDFSYKEMLVYRKPPRFYTETEIIRAVEEPVIIHFTTSFLSRRPWVEGCQHPWAFKWINYKQMSPWWNSPLWKYEKKGIMQEKYIFLIEKLPKYFGIALSGILHAYIRPFVNRVRLNDINKALSLRKSNNINAIEKAYEKM